MRGQDLARHLLVVQNLADVHASLLLHLLLLFLFLHFSLVVLVERFRITDNVSLHPFVVERKKRALFN